MRPNQLNFKQQFAEQLFSKATREENSGELASPPSMEPVDPFDEEQGSNRYRTIWISDIHLGTAGCQADALLHFLKHNESDTLYLVGDIIDGWQLRKNWFWPQSHNDVIQKVLRKARKGTQVVFIPGNHDEAARQFAGMTFGDIPILDSAVHVTADGKRTAQFEHTILVTETGADVLTGGTGAVSVTEPATRKRETNYKYGFGTQYAFTPALTLRLEAERYRVNDAVGQHGHIDLVSLGLVYRYGGSTPVLKTAYPAYVAPPAEPVVAQAPPAPAPVLVPVAPPAPPPASREYLLQQTPPPPAPHSSI